MPKQKRKRKTKQQNREANKDGEKEREMEAGPLRLTLSLPVTCYFLDAGLGAHQRQTIKPVAD
jgi:hypothetical protein